MSIGTICHTSSLYELAGMFGVHPDRADLTAAPANPDALRFRSYTLQTELLRACQNRRESTPNEPRQANTPVADDLHNPYRRRCRRKELQ
jgi:hypothetical protein